MSQPKVFFFGCWDRPGHYLHDANGRTVNEYSSQRECPFKPSRLDGAFAPQDCNEREDITALAHAHGYTILAMWDRSVDTRPACNAAFLAEGHHDEAAMWRLARQVFPKIAARLKASTAAFSLYSYACEAFDDKGVRIGGFEVRASDMPQALRLASQNIEVAIRPDQFALRVSKMDREAAAR